MKKKNQDIEIESAFTSFYLFIYLNDFHRFIG